MGNGRMPTWARRREIVSPVLANVFLHYVLDLWFHKKWRPNVPDGEAIIVRYADDIVVRFQDKRDAERYLRDVREMLARFRLRLHPDKTRLMEFGRFAVMNRRQRGVLKFPVPEAERPPDDPIHPSGGVFRCHN